jgi:hypothetical protein
MKLWFADKFFRVARRLGYDLHAGRLNWSDAQKFELKHAIAFMDDPSFKEWIERIDDPLSRVSKGYRDARFVSEFFGGDQARADEFFQHITGKMVLDIGPCVFTPLSFWDVASKRAIVEPLYNEVAQWQIENRGKNLFVNIDAPYATPAEKLIPELERKIDGAILVRNCIDHSPQWPFILSNISRYMAPGAVLLLWNDLTHPVSYLDGHYDITDDAVAFRRMLEDFGLRIDFEFRVPWASMLDYGCRATKL